jgi:hypothetical protein
MRFRLLEGQHVQADKSKPILGSDGKPTGRFERRTFKKNDVVESDIDLEARFGSSKFQTLEGASQAADDRIAQLEAELAKLKTEQAQKTAERSGGFRVPGDPSQEILLGSPSVAPGGQVSTGFQGPPPEEAQARTATAKQAQPRGQAPEGQQQQTVTGWGRPPGSGAQSPEEAEESAKQQQARTAAQASAKQPQQPQQQPSKSPSEAEYHASLDRMSVQELKSHAADEEIDLRGATRKEDMIRIIKGASR